MARRLAWTFVLLACTLVAPPAGAQREPRVIAIGDIHGDLVSFREILRSARLIDAHGGWAGGRDILVQTGDFTDRGSEVRGVLDMLMRLEREAERAGGKVITLLGNHEVMNLIGIWRDVTPEICAAFAGSTSTALRESAERAYEMLAARRGPLRPEAAAYRLSPDAWIASIPVGCLEYRDAMGPDGVYGRWLRDKPVVTTVGAVTFMHAGPRPAAAVERLNDLNNQVWEEIRKVDAFRARMVREGLALPAFDLSEMLNVFMTEARGVNAALAAGRESGTPPDLRGWEVELLRDMATMVEIDTWAVIDPEGPLWYRGWARPQADGVDAGIAALDRWGVRRFVVAHTVNPDFRIAVHYGGRVIAIDTGMLTTTYGGRASALEVAGGAFTAVYVDGRTPLGPRTD